MNVLQLAGFFVPKAFRLRSLRFLYSIILLALEASSLWRCSADIVHYHHGAALVPSFRNCLNRSCNNPRRTGQNSGIIAEKRYL